ncbi:cytochrome c [Pseudomonas kuykendallii]|uniref:Sulfite dehydrogenase (Cytochrome) subunit SorB n=1 Tax=Pseudomonas kuykendallii TaxID=1007099 RepID=A0A1H2XQN2_9PSED|nr:cytochrome c [Pseudomonas kuykendallii]MCQ4272621.1 cytochrome c [Pseudomonas kuykendallii]SDW95100.1 sulfite dehydrogenase (cytochrome) subunit SorB [Pseudomonas kuykendallii]
MHSRFLGALALAAACAPLTATALQVTLPAETAVYVPSELPGYQLVQQNCLICHSAQYVLTQPRTLPRSYWQATVEKMSKAFGAPFPEQDSAAMVDYLSRTYGAERPAAAAP